MPPRGTADTTWSRYGRQVRYVHLYAMPWKRRCPSAEPPADLRKAVLTPLDNLADPKGFEERILGMLWHKGIGGERLASLPPRRALLLAVQTVVDQMTYATVDTLPEYEALREKHGGLHRAVDVCFAIGKGDCDKYAALVSHVFDILKRRNPGLRGIYVVPYPIGADYTPADRRATHAWNAVLLFGEDTLYVSHIDATDCDRALANARHWSEAVDEDDPPGLEADESHIDPAHFLANFYWDLRDYRAALPLYLDVLKSEHADAYRAEFYDRSAFAAYVQGKLGVVEQIEPLFEAEKLGTLNPEQHARVLYWTAMALYEKHGKRDAVIERLRRLPDVAKGTYFEAILRRTAERDEAK